MTQTKIDSTQKKIFQRGFLFLSIWLLAACTEVYTWNQKLTVTLQTPDGPISASSVSRVTKTRTNAFWVPIEASGVQSGLQGEAVVLEVKPGRFLFVLLDGVDQLALRSFPQFSYSRDDEFGDWASAIEAHRGVGEVPVEFFPMMVTFADNSDPTSLAEVPVERIKDEFGDQYELLSLTLAIVDEGPTSGTVESALSWLEQIGERQANIKGLPTGGAVSDQPNPEIYYVAPSDFSTEIYK